MKDELNCYYNGGVDAYLLQSVAMHFNHTVYTENFPIIFSFRISVIFCIPMTLVIPYWNLKLFSLQLSSDKNYMNSFLNLYNYRNASFLIVINSGVREEVSDVNKSLCKKILLVSSCLCTSPLVRAPPQLTLFNSLTAYAW